jgi:hypothetical protein
MGDDFFHQGAFRQLYALGCAWGMERPAEAAKKAEALGLHSESQELLLFVIT